MKKFRVLTPRRCWQRVAQELKVNDYKHRRLFADWALERLVEHPNFGK